MAVNAPSKPPPEQEKSLEEKKKARRNSLWGRVVGYGEKLANNVRPLDLYARLKDFYKLIEVVIPWVINSWVKRTVDSHRDNPFYQKNITSLTETADYFRNLFGVTKGADPAKIAEAVEKFRQGEQSLSRDALLNIARDTISRDENYHLKQELREPSEVMKSLKVGVTGDVIFTGIMQLLTGFSGWAEKKQVKRVYGDLVASQLGIPKEQVTYEDFKQNSNPMIRQAANYYGNKAFWYNITNVIGLIRLIPLVAYSLDRSKTLISKPKDSAFGKFLYGTANFGEGIKLLLGFKSLFFLGYFSNRQTGAFYEVKDLWNKLEGANKAPNRAMNENVRSGEFVRWQEIRSIYERFREENPGMGMSEFTHDDPLSALVFDRASRYLNHTYMPKLFRGLERNKIDGVTDKKLTHAMLVDLIGSGGLRVEDAIGSAIRLDIMAHYGNQSVALGMQRFREADAMLQKINRPTLGEYATPDLAVEALHSYFTQMNSVAEHFLGDTWPTPYFEKEIKPGYIDYFFKGNPPKDKLDYLTNAIAVSRENTTVTTSKNTAFSHEELQKNMQERDQETFAPKTSISGLSHKELQGWIDRSKKEGATTIKRPEKTQKHTDLAFTEAAPLQI